MNPFYSLVAMVRATPAGAVAARLWHRCAPSFKVRRRVFGLDMYFDFRDNAIWWTKQNLEHADIAWEILEHFNRVNATVWDVGANVGIFALRAASLGHQVIAFDISQKALDLLTLSARANDLNIIPVRHAFSTRSFRYEEPTSADTENDVQECEQGTGCSITFLEAARQFPMPDLLKMDIEGAEVEFIRSPEFKHWILENKIPWVIEFHSPDFLTMLWDECDFVRLGANHLGLNLDSLWNLEKGEISPTTKIAA